MKQTKILIVDDSPIDVLLLREYLIRLNFKRENILHVSTGEEAIKLYKANPTSIKFILMDVRLTGKLTGYQTTSEIMKISPVPIIMESAQYLPEQPEVGYVGYLPKPYSKEHLSELLTSLSLI